jgi:hypothetical protein
MRQMAPTLHRFAGRCPPRGREFSLGRPGAEFMTPMLHRCAGRFPRNRKEPIQGLIRLRVARRRIA